MVKSIDKLIVLFVDGYHAKGGEITVKQPNYLGMADIFVE